MLLLEIKGAIVPLSNCRVRAMPMELLVRALFLIMGVPFIAPEQLIICMP